MKKTIFQIVFLAGIVFMTSCKKDDNSPAPSNNNNNNNNNSNNSAKAALLTANAWTYTASTADIPVDVDGDGNSSTDVYSQESICQTDVDYTFNSNKSGSVSGNCGGATAQSSWGFSWAFNSAGTAILVTLAGDVTTMTIIQLDANTLKVSYPYTDHNNLAYTKTVTFTKKQ